MLFSNFSVPINLFSISVFIVICLISYYLIFREHHKRNKLKFHEIYPLVINYLIICIISFFVVLFGVDNIFTGYKYYEEIFELIKQLIIGITIISLVIINFIFYIKRHKVDLIIEERKAQDVKDSKIAEIIEIVVLTVMFILPIFNVFRYIKYWNNFEKIKYIFGGILFMIISAFLLFSLNPLNIRDKVKKFFK